MESGEEMESLIENRGTEKKERWNERVVSCLRGISCIGWFKIAFISIIIIIVSTFLITPIVLAIFGDGDSKFQQLLLDIFNYIQSIPSWLKALFMIEVYAFTIPFGCPITPINLVSGFFFGWFFGSIVALIGGSLAASICYLWALTMVQEWAEKKLNSKRIFKAIELAVRDEAVKLIILTHICPVFSTTILNYLFATMGVNYPKFIIATIMGFMPLAIMYCVIGSLSGDLVTAIQGGTGDATWKLLILLVLSIVSVVFLVVILIYIGKRKIQTLMRMLEEQERAAEFVHDPEADSEVVVQIDRYKTSAIVNSHSHGDYDDDDY